MNPGAAEIIQDAYQNPRNRGELARPTHSAEGENRMCGDSVHVDLVIRGGHIFQARFRGRGCAISQASAELILNRLHDQPVGAIDELDRASVLEELGLPDISPARLRCALLPVEVLKQAIRAE